MNHEPLVVTGSGVVATVSAWEQLADLQQACDDSIRVIAGRLRYVPRRPLHEDVEYMIECLESEMIALLQDSSERVVH